MNIKLVLVDDHELIINGIKSLLSPYPRYQVVGQADNGLEVYGLCSETHPDIVILDLGLPGMDGQDVVVQLLRRWPAMRIIALTSRQGEHHAARALRLGALGYVLKSSTQQCLISAMQSVFNRKRYIDPALDHFRVFQLMDETGHHPLSLTLRERQVLKQIAEGVGNHTIANNLSISPKTVETHRLNIMRKLDVHKAIELVHWSHRLGLVEYR
ncbi:two component system response regulator [Acerihabitans arboris]|uniref:Two component system response regulator n=1 Tax=Acerihabitans arboris TaxID=2691583 RepID=A0A845SP89_9GAMM|nr:two component system response regulator [Acerihabitans arboris]NDL64401.1 two component system response regulator [Acerihabitans arboris]